MNLFKKKELEAIGKALIKRGETLAVAESVTAGLLQFALSNIPDATKFYQGGITAYNLGQKFKHLKVEPIHALEVNCVSQRVALEMATHICGQFCSDWGVGVTGYASPTPESGDKVFAYYAIVHKGRVKRQGRIAPAKLDPPDLQLRYVNTVVHALYGLL